MFSDTCNINFDAETFVWAFNSKPCGTKMFIWMGFIYEIIIFIIAILIDIAIFIRLRQIQKV